MSLVPIENSLTLPDSIDEAGLIVGWSLEREHRRQPIGFKFGKAASGGPATAVINPILMEREGHLMTIAPTGAGKGTGCIVPALLRFDGPVIVIDPKGENALMTVRRRRELGQEVAVIDPMGVTGLATASLNPLDILDPDSPTFVDDAWLWSRPWPTPTPKPMSATVATGASAGGRSCSGWCCTW